MFENHFSSTNGQSIVTGSSFSYCRSFCVKGYTHDNALISNNVFFEARKFHIKINQITTFIVSNNLMVGAIIRPTVGAK